MRQAVGRSIVALLIAAGPLFAQDGELDTTWAGGDGIFSFSNGTDYAVAKTVAPLGDGALLVGGAAGPDEGDLDFYVLRLSPLGELDVSWGDFGRKSVAIDRVTNGTDELLRVVPDATGAAVLLGRAKESPFVGFPALARLTPAGEVDEDFGTLGIVTPAAHPWTGTIFVQAAAAHLDGFLFFGSCTACGAGGVPGLFLYRTTASGAPDGSFGAAGWLGLGIADAGAAAALATRADGRIVFGAKITPMLGSAQLNVYRRLGNGSPDTGWNGTGLAIYVYDEAGWTPNALALDPVDGGVVVSHYRAGGVEVAASGLVRFSGGGVRDAAFGFPELAYDQGSYLQELAIDGAQRIAGAGFIDGPSAQPGGFFFARLLVSGELDDSFDGNGVKRVEIDEVANGFDGAYGLALSGGRAVAAGFGQTLDGGFRFAVVRLTNALIFRDGFERGSTASWGL